FSSRRRHTISNLDWSSDVRSTDLVDRLREVIAQGPIPKVTTPDDRTRIVLAVDMSNWLRPDAATSPDRAYCHTYARAAGQADMKIGRASCRERVQGNWWDG